MRDDRESESEAVTVGAARWRPELTAVVLFVAINLVAPFVVGEMYPFTVSPMFCDQPSQYCTYELFDENGNELDLEQYGLHLVYDGNPPGLGMGIEATPTMHDFGEVPAIEVVSQHLSSCAESNSEAPATIRVCQYVTRCNGTCPETTMREETVNLLSRFQETE